MPEKKKDFSKTDITDAVKDAMKDTRPPLPPMGLMPDRSVKNTPPPPAPVFDPRRMVIPAALIVPLCVGLIWCYDRWSTSTGDRWTRAEAKEVHRDLHEWVHQVQKDNPALKIPDLFDFPDEKE